MKGKIIELYQRIIGIGVTKELDFSVRRQVELVNHFTIITIPGLVFHLLYNFFGPNDTKEYFISIVLSSIIITTLTFNYFKKYKSAQITITLISILAAGMLHVLSGISLRIEPMYIVLTLVICYFFYNQNTILTSLLSLILIVYVLVHISLIFYTPIYKDQIIPSAPYSYFLVAYLATILVTLRVLRENQRYNKKYTTQNKILIEKNDELNRFTNIASHDLKSPIRNIVSFSDLIERNLNRSNYDDIPEYLKIIKTSAKQMQYLIEDILEFSKINNEEQNNTKKRIDLNKLVNKIKAILVSELDGKNGQIINQGLPNYYCNELEFTILFQNLIQNGIKYNERKKPTIEIWYKEQADSIKIYIKDNGIGIEQAYHQQVFDLFKRLHTNEVYEGTGVGLSLCKKIVSKYKGQIEIQSALQMGSTFIITLPPCPTENTKSPKAAL